MAKENKKGAAEAAPEIEATTVVLSIAGRAQINATCEALDSEAVIVPRAIAEALLEAGLAQKV